MALADSGWRLEAEPLMWEVEGEVSEKNRLDISAVAGFPDGNGLLAGDEMRQINLIRIERETKRLVIGESVELLPGKGTELDLEGATASVSGKCFYIIGSHGMARNKAEFQPDRSHVFRLPLDSGGSGARSHRIEVTTLRDALLAHPMLALTVDRSPNDNGIDIEGLAERKGTLFVGFRSPLLDDKAVVLEANAAELFAKPKTVTVETHLLDLGPGFGVRSMTALAQGYLVLAGASGTVEVSGFALHHWEGPGGAVRKIVDLPELEGKPEGMMVLDESAEVVELLIIRDGSENGGPFSIRLLKP